MSKCVERKKYIEYLAVVVVGVIIVVVVVGVVIFVVVDFVVLT